MRKSILITFFFFILSLGFLALTLSNVDSSKLNKGSVIPTVLSKFTSTNDSFNAFNKLISKIEQEQGTYSIYIKNLNDSRNYTYNSTNIYYAASLYKLPIGVAALKQIQEDKLSLDTKMQYLPKHYADGTGIINQSDYGTDYTVDQVLNALYKHSDNVAQEMLLDLLDVDSKNVSNAFPSQGTTDYYHLNKSSAKEIGDYISYIFTSNYLTDESKTYLINVMKDTEFDYLLADTLNSPFSNKIGLYGGIIHDCGYIASSNLVVCLMSENTDPTTFTKVGTYLADFLNSF
jgi:beta-lactamase class A